MRVLLVIFALVVAPLATIVGQSQPVKPVTGNNSGVRRAVGPGGLGHDALHCANRAANSPTDRPFNKCPVDDPSPPPPPATCGQLPATGGATVTGQVFNATDFSNLQGWCVHLTGTDLAGNAITGSVLTGPLVNFTNFTFSVPGGTYTVCEEIPSGWAQTFPPAPQGGATCPQGFGWQFMVMDGGSADFNNFGNGVVP